MKRNEEEEEEEEEFEEEEMNRGGKSEVRKTLGVLICGTLVYYHCAYRNSSLLSLFSDVLIVLLCSLAILGLLFRQMNISGNGPNESHMLKNGFVIGFKTTFFRVCSTRVVTIRFVRVVFYLCVAVTIGIKRTTLWAILVVAPFLGGLPIPWRVPVDPLEWQISQDTANSIVVWFANTVGAAESVLRVAATGHDKRLFFKVVVCLYILSALGRLVSGVTVAYAGLCLFCLYMFAENSRSISSCVSRFLRRRNSTAAEVDNM
ncbi:hypothetical protein Patl1_35241 [Pistacia atlantica]|uniref:Uncharacterized protein n=1 Tax=Pistacia atlantica TaxID=434234 RepID=A0ACC0ZUK4_9ROSI|nr:hypothetical protein Patl1_35241 [Pistacia atlantica]